MHFQVMAKPVGAACNLKCVYCYYTEKKSLYDSPAPWKMPLEVLETFIQQYIACQESGEIQFVWQGGEPILLGVEFFKLVVSLQRKYAGRKKVVNSIQTNGTLLTDEWCAFFRKNGFLVGLSIDGPRKIHNQYRVTKSGQPTFDLVMSGVELLAKHGVSFNTLTVVNDHNSLHPLKVYRFLKNIGQGHMQFIPAVERRPDDFAVGLGMGFAMPLFYSGSAAHTQVTPWSVDPRRLADFYISIFDHWVRHDVGRVFVQFFEVALANWLGAGSGLCNFSPRCGLGPVLEHNGDLYSCDHYVYPAHRLGNIMETPLPVLMDSKPQRRFGNYKWESLPECCLGCEVRPACHGDCPKNRFTPTPEGGLGLSYLCEAYKRIFTHMAPYLGIMADLLLEGRTVSRIMQILNRQGMPSAI